jgi:hypothetical protein
VVFADLISLWVIFSIKQDFIPYFQLYLSFGLLGGVSAVLFPYLAYVFRFLHPSTLLQRFGGGGRGRGGCRGRGGAPSPGAGSGPRSSASW